jgi:hypothetical protein
VTNLKKKTEIAKAIKQRQNYKAPGPDNVPAKALKGSLYHFWIWIRIFLK